MQWHFPNPGRIDQTFREALLLQRNPELRASVGGGIQIQLVVVAAAVIVAFEIGAVESVAGVNLQRHGLLKLEGAATLQPVFCRE